MDVNALQTLATSLIEKTKKRQAQWGKTSRPYEFILRLPSGAITTDDFGTTRGDVFDLIVLNSRGDAVANLKQQRGEPLYSLLSDLHGAAMGNYYNVDGTIEALLSELKVDGRVGDGKTELTQDTPF